MSLNKEHSERIRGYLFFVLAIIGAVMSVGWGIVLNPIAGLFLIPIIAVMIYLSYRSFQADRGGKITADERSKRLVERASFPAFLVTVSVMLAEDSLRTVFEVTHPFGFAPKGTAVPIYALIGGGVFVLVWLYIRYIETEDG